MLKAISSIRTDKTPDAQMRPDQPVSLNVFSAWPRNVKNIEYKTIIAGSYHQVEKVANELSALGYQVLQVTPVLSGQIVLLGGK